jgi:hypothetical protein
MNKNMSRYFHFCCSCLLLGQVSAKGDDQVPDWRLELLTEVSLTSDTPSLEKIVKSFAFSQEDFTGAVALLGDPKLSVRRQAQEAILRMGPASLPHIKEASRNADAETQMRLSEIATSFDNEERCHGRSLLFEAVTGLLYERANPGKEHASRRVYREIFSQATESLATGYRGMKMDASLKTEGVVKDGILRFRSANGNIDTDHRLLLTAKSCTGKPEFPKVLRFQVKIGGEGEREGSYHVGVSLGKVRALYHPGYAGGGFRFQNVGAENMLTTNQSMGFTPSVKRLQTMRCRVEKQDDGKVKWDVWITDGEKTFQKSHVFSAQEIGSFDVLGLDRSGFPGGAAMFDDLLVEW